MSDDIVIKPFDPKKPDAGRLRGQEIVPKKGMDFDKTAGTTAAAVLLF